MHLYETHLCDSWMQDRYAGLPQGGLRGGRGGGRGLRGGLGGRGGGFGGGFAGGRGGFAGGRGGFNGNRDGTADLYAPYAGPEGNANGGAMDTDMSAAPGGMGMGGGGGGFGMQGAYGGGGYGGFGGGAGAGAGAYVEAEPSQQIVVRNLPWSTAHDDLVELFETTGAVEVAEILFEGTRSKGMGVVQFTQVAEAETAIAKFQGYVYGGRPLGASLSLGYVDGS
jgi:hypothetical protein